MTMKHLKLLGLIAPLFSCAAGCAGEPFSTGSYSDSMAAGAAGVLDPDGAAGASTGGRGAAGERSTGGTVPTGGRQTGGVAPTGGRETGGTETGGVEAGGALPTGGTGTGGEQTGGVAPTGGRETGGTETGGVEAGGALPTGGTPATGGTEPTGITCGDESCEDGVSCCLPWTTSTAPFCLDAAIPKGFCGPSGTTILGTVAACTSPEDCDTHCCVTFELYGAVTRPVSSACGNCTDGKDGHAYACETDADCAAGRHCKQRTDLAWLPFKTCGA